LLGFLLFCVPAIAIIASGRYGFERTAIWTVALAILGGACLANSLRCGRIHCYLTGPFFLIMALITLLYGSGVLPLGKHGWNTIELTVLLGAIVLSCLPEMIFGKYGKQRDGTTDPP
jgi:hypothetical protein